MIKLMIVDDEPKIRRGLAKSLPWEEMDIQIIGEAEDGRQALERAKEFEPDIMFLDTYMPYLNGIEVARELRVILPECIVIIISGYDEFKYAQEAISCGVYSYILKPVDKDQLRNIVQEAIALRFAQKQERRYSKWAETYIGDHHEDLKKSLLLNWIQFNPGCAAIQRDMEMIGLDYNEKYVMAVYKKIDIHTDDIALSGHPSLIDTATSIFKDAYGGREIIAEYRDDVVLCLFAYSDGVDTDKWLLDASRRMQEDGGCLVVYSYSAIDTVSVLCSIWSELLSSLEEKARFSPTTLLIKSYIEQHYADPDLNLRDAAQSLAISESYVCRVLKKELDCTFTEYVTARRMELARKYLKSPQTKVYEVAEKVGYKTQHYFSRVFKQETGMTPIEYKNSLKRY